MFTTNSHDIYYVTYYYHVFFQGKYLTLGADINSYTVTIGQGECRVIELLSNVINCVPPQNEPEDKSGPWSMAGKPTVIVSIVFYHTYTQENLDIRNFF